YLQISMDRLISLMTFVVTTGLIISNPACGVSPYKKDAIAIHFALVGPQAIDEDAIINIVSQRTTCELQQISGAYESRYGEKIVHDIRDHLTGKFEELIVALLTKCTDFYAQEVYNALNGIKNNEKVLFDILLTQNHIKLQAIQEVYQNNYQKSLKDDLEQFTTNNLKKLYIKMLETQRNKSTDINYIDAEKDARELYHAAIPEDGAPNPDKFAEILTSVSYTQLRHIIMKFNDIFDQHIETVIDNNFVGDFSRTLIAIVQYARSKEGYIANRLYDGLANDFDYRSLIRLMVICKNVGLQSIREAIQIRHRVASEYYLSLIADAGFRKTLSTFFFSRN
ncbi:Similar to ANXA13: Annexin A13 (Canis lupus familiaris), partial [Cotesia congregata]